MNAINTVFIIYIVLKTNVRIVNKIKEPHSE